MTFLRVDPTGVDLTSYLGIICPFVMWWEISRSCVMHWTAAVSYSLQPCWETSTLETFSTTSSVRLPRETQSYGELESPAWYLVLRVGRTVWFERVVQIWELVLVQKIGLNGVFGWTEGLGLLKVWCLKPNVRWIVQSWVSLQIRGQKSVKSLV